jgi:hypothetical protein
MSIGHDFGHRKIEDLIVFEIVTPFESVVFGLQIELEYLIEDEPEQGVPIEGGMHPTECVDNRIGCCDAGRSHSLDHP